MSHLLTILAVPALLLGCQRAATPQQEAAVEAAAAQAATAQDAATGEVVAVRYADPEARRAAELLDTGHPWRATSALAPLLADPARRTPEVVLLAATAAAGWGGWRTVDSLLAGAAWVDSLADGAGRELLARAALDRAANDTAALHAGRAAALARDDRARGERLVFLARALDRLDRADSARAAYARAAALLPDVGDWLELRAAGVATDPAAREAHYARVRRPAARERARWTEAHARERFGDLAGASRLFDSLGAPGAALRARTYLALRDSALRPDVRRELVALVERRAGTTDARTAVELLDAHFAPLAPREELLVARSAARSGPLGRAATAYARASSGGATAARDHLDHALVLDRLGRRAEAATVLARITAPAPLAAVAGYHRGRTLVNAGDVAAGRRALRDVVARFPRDSSAGLALMLLADLATDEGRDAAAREAYRSAVAILPAGARASTARFRAALVARAAGSHRQAAAEWDSLARLDPKGAETNAAIYWAARAWASAGDSVAARERWRAVIERDPLSYYAAAAARRLGEPAWAPPAAEEPEPADAPVETVERASLLDLLGMDTEQRLELDALAADAIASKDAARMLAAAAALRAGGHASRGITLALRAIEAGAPRDARLYRLLYPIAHREALVEDARANRLDPALVAALIRQESRWTARATSGAGARGLMQVMPAVGASLAGTLGVRPWDPVLLYEPEVSLLLGTRHLRNYLARYDAQRDTSGAAPHARALAAYNAGQSRVTRWDRKAGVEDAELFVERIPFTETRDYVRIVHRNAELYRALYGW